MSDPSRPPSRGGLARSVGRLFEAAPSSDDGEAVRSTTRDDAPDVSPSTRGAPSREQTPAEDPATLVRDLGAERDPEALEVLIARAGRAGAPVAFALADALSRTEDRSARRAYLAALRAMGPAALPAVEAIMDDPRWFVVRNGIRVLREIGGARAVASITGALGRPEPKLRREALLALARIGGEDAGMLAYGMLEDPDASVRAAAAVAVGRTRLERAVRPLIRLLHEEDDLEVLVEALRALGELGDPGAVQAIERHATGSFLRRPPPELRIAAYGALHRIGTPRARRLLNQAVDDRSPEVRSEARRLLGMA